MTPANSGPPGGDAQAARLIQLAAVAAPEAAPFAAERLPGGASNRRYYRLQGRSRSLVAMVLPPEPGAAEEASLVRAGSAVSELPFLNVRRYLAGLGIRVPALVEDVSSEGVLLLEDLGDLTLEGALSEHPGGLSLNELYGLAVDLLAELRAKAERQPDPACLAFGRSFEESLYRWELDHYLYWGFAARLAGEPTPAEAAVFRVAFDRIAAQLAAMPRGFTHRDYQSRNLMAVPDERGGRPALAIIDFQDALLGPRQYDLVALLRDSYVQLPAALVDGLIARYLDHFRALSGEAIDAADFRRDFDLLTVQRKLKDGGRFVFIDRVKGNPSFLPAVAASFGYVGEALERLPELAELRTVLRQRHPEMAG